MNLALKPFAIRTLVATLGVFTLALAAPSVGAQERQLSDAEERARLERRGAGARIGFWSVGGLREVPDARYGKSALFEGYFQHGLDRHLALQNSVGFWRRSQEIVVSAIGGPRRESIDSYVIPMFTALRFFPATSPGEEFEPYVEGGVGVALGVDDRSTSASDPLGAGDGSGIAMGLGVGLKAGVGAEWRFSPALGLALGGRYQWLRFLGDLGGESLYRGFGAEVGLTYRFQFE